MASCFVINFVLINYGNASQLNFVLLDPRLWAEETYKLGLSILPSKNFPEIPSLLFSGTQHWVRGSCGAVCDTAIFLKIIVSPQK